MEDKSYCFYPIVYPFVIFIFELLLKDKLQILINRALDKLGKVRGRGTGMPDKHFFLFLCENIINWKCLAKTIPITTNNIKTINIV